MYTFLCYWVQWRELLLNHDPSNSLGMEYLRFKMQCICSDLLMYLDGRYRIQIEDDVLVEDKFKFADRPDFEPSNYHEDLILYSETLEASRPCS